MTEVKFADLSAEERKLINEAEKALVNSYNPYNSRMKVAAAVRTRSGEVVTGANYGNDVSPSNICAERAVILTANSLGKRDIVAMAIIGIRDVTPVEKPVMPCGACRQVMKESNLITGSDMLVFCSNTDKSRIIKSTVNELLPATYDGGGWGITADTDLSE